MSQELTTQAKSQAPALSDQKFRDLLGRYRNAIEGTRPGHYSISDRLMPVGEDRAAMETRLQSLGQAFAPAKAAMPIALLEARIARLFLRFPSASKVGAEETVRAYAFDLSGFPLWAIDQAIKNVIGGAGSASRGFVPSSPELQAECRLVMRPFQREAADLASVLGADVYHKPSDEELASMKAKFEELVRDLRLGSNFDAPKKTGAPADVAKA